MKVSETSLPEVKLIEPDVFTDTRGFFLETWNAQAFSRAGIEAEFVQDNLSESTQHTLRGLHYQIKQPQGKLVRVTRGHVFDVAVDIRKSSTSFGQWTGVHLSGDDRHMLWVPPGFAHGFLVLSEIAIFEYKCTDYYAPMHERSIRWNDPQFGIDWPLPKNVQPELSAKDAAAGDFRDADLYP